MRIEPNLKTENDIHPITGTLCTSAAVMAADAVSGSTLASPCGLHQLEQQSTSPSHSRPILKGRREETFLYPLELDMPKNGQSLGIVLESKGDEPPFVLKCDQNCTTGRMLKRGAVILYINGRPAKGRDHVSKTLYSTKETVTLVICESMLDEILLRSRQGGLKNRELISLFEEHCDRFSSLGRVCYDFLRAAEEWKKAWLSRSPEERSQYLTALLESFKKRASKRYPRLLTELWKAQAASASPHSTVLQPACNAAKAFLKQSLWPEFERGATAAKMRGLLLEMGSDISLHQSKRPSASDPAHGVSTFRESSYVCTPPLVRSASEVSFHAGACRFAPPPNPGGSNYFDKYATLAATREALLEACIRTSCAFGEVNKWSFSLGKGTRGTEPRCMWRLISPCLGSCMLTLQREAIEYKLRQWHVAHGDTDEVKEMQVSCCVRCVAAVPFVRACVLAQHLGVLRNFKRIQVFSQRASSFTASRLDGSAHGSHRSQHSSAVLRRPSQPQPQPLEPRSSRSDSTTQTSFETHTPSRLGRSSTNVDTLREASEKTQKHVQVQVAPSSNTMDRSRSPSPASTRTRKQVNC